MEEYKGNSYKSKTNPAPPEKKVVEKVEGAVRVKKKEITKIKDVFISEDAANVKSYIFMDVLVPAIKKAVKDIVTNGIEMILYGETGRRGRDRGETGASYVSYNRMSDRDDRFRSSVRNRTGYDFDDILLKSRGDAEAVLDQMCGMLDKYKIVSVADLYDIVNLSSDYTDNKYGWTNLRNAEAVRVSDGYILKLPKPMPFD